MPETKKLLGSTKSKITKDKNGENVPPFDITEAVLKPCNLYTFVPNKSFDQLLDISLKNFIFLKAFNSEFSYS